jgi:hypothetical protein
LSVLRWSRSQPVRARVAPARTPVITARVIRVRRGWGPWGCCGDRVIGCSLDVGDESGASAGLRIQIRPVSRGLT